MAEEKKKSPSFEEIRAKTTGGVINQYNSELTEIQEKTIGNVVRLLKRHEVVDEIHRAKCIAKNKAFVRDVFNAGVESGLL